MTNCFDEVSTELYCDTFLQKRDTLSFKISTQESTEAMQVHVHLWAKHIGKGFTSQQPFLTPIPWFVTVRVASIFARQKHVPASQLQTIPIT
jgi:hypothetical protein